MLSGRHTAPHIHWKVRSGELTGLPGVFIVYDFSLGPQPLPFHRVLAYRDSHYCGLLEMSVVRFTSKGVAKALP